MNSRQQIAASDIALQGLWSLQIRGRFSSPPQISLHLMAPRLRITIKIVMWGGGERKTPPYQIMHFLHTWLIIYPDDSQKIADHFGLMPEDHLYLLH